MATRILRTVDRWRFETPLATALAAATVFAVLAMPRELFGHVPVAGRMGMPGHVVLALLLAIVCGIVGYRAMRRPAKVLPVDDDVDLPGGIDTPSGISEDRLVRLRRADRHPDAPPRAPIRASRDLGEPFMDVGAFVPPPAHGGPEPAPADEVDGGDVDIPKFLQAPIEAVAAPEPADAPAEVAPIADVAPVDAYALGTPFVVSPAEEQSAEETPVVSPPIIEAPVVDASPAVAIVPAAAPRRQDESIAAMTARLSAGMERRAGRPVAAARDMRPALRDALDELNRLAERRG